MSKPRAQIGLTLSFLLLFLHGAIAEPMRMVQGGQVIETLKPLLGAAPQVLFASVPALPPGEYELHWSARSMADGSVT